MEQVEPVRHESRTQPMRLSLVLSGAVALGTFEAGVVFELMRAVQRGAPLTIDVIAGASAGSLVSAVTAKSLVSGAPFEYVLPRWGDYTLQHLTAGYETVDEARRAGKPLDRGILSTRAVKQILEQNLVSEPVERPFQPAYPAPRLCLTMTLTNIDGLPLIGGVGHDSRFTEAVTFRFTPPDPEHLAQSPYPPAVWQRVARIAQASGMFPGAFDPLHIPWAERLWIPNRLEEIWEHDSVLERLHRADPRIQPRMLYNDGGILDNQPAERAIADLPLVTGGTGEPGLESLVYDPRRCMLFIEPEPPVSTPDELQSGANRTWFDLFNRSFHLWTVASSPYIGRPRVHTTNTKLDRLFRFLAELGRHITVNRQGPAVGDAVEQFLRANPELDVLRRAGERLGPQQEQLGLINPALFKEAVHVFYQWLASDRYERDLEWVEGLPPGRIRQAHQTVLTALQELRGAYTGLWGLDPRSPDSHQALLEEIHVSLANSLGLTQPWVGLCQITPDDPDILRGDMLYNFGGFFSAEFLRHDYEVGRHYAYLWLKEAIPEYEAEEAPRLPTTPHSGLNWRHLWQNRVPLWRIAGRTLAAVLEAAGLNYAGGGLLLTRVLGWSLLLAIVHGFAMLVGAWFGWITFPAEYQRFRFWVLLGTSLFPLVIGIFLGLAFRRKVP